MSPALQLDSSLCKKRGGPAKWATCNNTEMRQSQTKWSFARENIRNVSAWTKLSQLLHACFVSLQAGVPTINSTAILDIIVIMYSTGIDQTSAHNVHFEPVQRLNAVATVRFATYVHLKQLLRITPASIQPVEISKFKNLNRGNGGRVQHQNTAESW